MRNHRICLVCREVGVDKSNSVGRSASTGPLLGHLRTHNLEYLEYIEAKDAALMEASKVAAAEDVDQMSIVSYFPTVANTKLLFKRKFAKWVVEESMPLSVGESETIIDMVRTANKHLIVPDHKMLIDILSGKKIEASSKLKLFLKDRFFSITSDHWTSIANENYGALTLHLIDQFELKAFVMSCMKHANGTTAVEVETQLSADLQTWGLDGTHLFCCVTDTASNMNAFGISVSSWPTAPFIRHHYCADHVLQLTAVKAFSGEIESSIPHLFLDNQDTTVVAVKKARALVTFFHSSSRASDKLCDAQQALDPSCIPLKLLSDVKTRWWSTHTLLERVLCLKDALNYVFDNEFRFRNEVSTLTTLESMRLTDEDFQSLHNVLYVLTPFKDAQKALEGEQYVNISLSPLAINNLHTSLLNCEASVDQETEGSLYQLIQTMIDDFNRRWGERCIYLSSTVRGFRNRQIGIPTYAFWATALDPRTKKKLSKVLNQQDIASLWHDIEQAISRLINLIPNNNMLQEEEEEPAAPLNAVNRILNNNNNFFADSDDEEEEENSTVPVSIDDTVNAELWNYRAEKGQSLYSRGDTGGSFNDPLVWWKLHADKYPHVWKLASIVLAIPATSAPSERVFSAAANIVNKKRVRLKSENVDLLVFLKANKQFVDWE